MVSEQNRLPLPSICLRDFSDIYKAQETDAFQTLGNIQQFEIVQDFPRKSSKCFL